jgi:uncharacterized protein (UPF0261 family)
MSKKVVGILGTLDSKGEEYAFLKRQIETQGVDTLVIDAGVLGAPAFEPDVPAATVARAGGVELQHLVEEKDRGHAMAVMSAGAAAVVKRLQEEGRIHGIIAMGGGGGSSIGSAAMRALPIGVPKLLISTVASGDTRAYVDVKDITMTPSIVDISGINRLSAKILTNAAGAIAGMVKIEPPKIAEDKPLIAATMFGVTTPCVTKAREIIEKAGFEVLVFHAVGVGGRTMEELIRAGYIAGVLDITTTELADELAGGILSAGPHRLEAASEMGVPQVVSTGALDMVNFGPADSIPAKYKGRKLYPHNPLNTLMRTTIEENRVLGRQIAEKLNRAKGPTTFMLPRRGFSLLDMEGKAFYDPTADSGFIEVLKANLSQNVELVEMDADINDEKFATEAANRLLAIVKH